MTQYDPSVHNDSRPNVGVTVVPIIYDLLDGKIKTMVYKRSKDAEQFPGMLSLPNGIYDRQVVNTADKAAKKALRDKLNTKIPHMEQLYTFTGDYIDPGRINTVNICYWSVLRKDDVVSSANPMFEPEWVDVDRLLKKKKTAFAFNHKEVLQMAVDRIKAKAEYTPVAISLLPDLFTIPEFKALTEKLIDQELNNTRFRDRLKKSQLIIPEPGMTRSGDVGPRSQLYRANPDFKGEFYPKSMTSSAGTRK